MEFGKGIALHTGRGGSRMVAGCCGGYCSHECRKCAVHHSVEWCGQFAETVGFRQLEIRVCFPMRKLIAMMVVVCVCFALSNVDAATWSQKTVIREVAHKRSCSGSKQAKACSGAKAKDVQGR